VTDGPTQNNRAPAPAGGINSAQAVASAVPDTNTSMGTWTKDRFVEATRQEIAANGLSTPATPAPTAAPVTVRNATPTPDSASADTSTTTVSQRLTTAASRADSLIRTRIEAPPDAKPDHHIFGWHISDSTMTTINDAGDFLRRGTQLFRTAVAGCTGAATAASTIASANAGAAVWGARIASVSTTIATNGFVRWVSSKAPGIVGIVDGWIDYNADKVQGRKIYTGIGSAVGSGAGCLLGLSAGAGAGGLAGAWLGGLIGSAVPVAGTAAGAAIGLAVGVGVSIACTEFGRWAGKAAVQFWYAQRHPEEHQNNHPAAASRPPLLQSAHTPQGPSQTTTPAPTDSTATNTEPLAPIQSLETRSQILKVAPDIYLPLLKKHHPNASDEDCRAMATNKIPDRGTIDATVDAVREINTKVFHLPPGGYSEEFKQRLEDAAKKANSPRSQQAQAPGPVEIPLGEARNTVTPDRKKKIDDAAAVAAADAQRCVEARQSPQDVLHKFMERGFGSEGVKALQEAISKGKPSLIEQMARNKAYSPQDIAQCAQEVYPGKYTNEALNEAVDIYRKLTGFIVTPAERGAVRSEIKNKHGEDRSMTVVARAFTDLLGGEWELDYNRYVQSHPDKFDQRYGLFDYVIGEHGKHVLSNQQLRAHGIGVD
jgi:hypothetical protein